MDVTRFLRHTVTLERRTSTDAYSGNSYATAVSIKARWYTAESVVRDNQGREVISGAHLSTIVVISEGDRVTDEDGRAREVVRVRKNYDTRGRFSHYVAYLA